MGINYDPLDKRPTLIPTTWDANGYPERRPEWKDSLARIAAVLCVVAVALVLTACSTVRGPAPVPDAVKLLPPDSLLRACPYTGPEPDTNGDLARAYGQARRDLAQCDSDKGLLREWAGQPGAEAKSKI